MSTENQSEEPNGPFPSRKVASVELNDATPIERQSAGLEPALASTQSQVPFDQLREACQSFSGEWEAGTRPDLPSYLIKVAKDDQATLLKNLLHYEIRKRRENGESPSVRDYLDAIPEHSNVVRGVFLEASSISLSGGVETRSLSDNESPIAGLLGDYRIIRELGRGGMGAVYEAINVKRDQRVALKTLPVVSGEALHRFKQEFRHAAEITHPNLVGLQTLENDGGQWFITMELIKGVSFRDWVRPRDTLSETRLRAALGQLVTGVMALHARGIVHRDLKPGNVMVDHQGRVIILDFGLAVKVLDETRSGRLAGTPAYMAPEQAGGESVGPPADWYAVGVMLYEALAGRRPFESQDYLELMRLKQGQPPRLPDTEVSLPRDLEELSVKLLEREPLHRPDPMQIAGTVSAAAVSHVQSDKASEELVGRESQFAALTEMLRDLERQDAPVTGFIKGRSGEGKTSLAEAFISPLREDPSWVVLSGRCYDRESVPFKALVLCQVKELGYR